MEKQNITLSLPKSLIKKVKVIAITENKSISELLRESLEDRIKKESGYLEARKRQVEYLEKGFDLGTNGKIALKRDSLHERK